MPAIKRFLEISIEFPLQKYFAIFANWPGQMSRPCNAGQIKLILVQSDCGWPPITRKFEVKGHLVYKDALLAAF